MDLEKLSVHVAEILKSTPEYKEFRRLLDEIKKDPSLYERVNELRAKNFRIQMSDSEDALDELDALTNEYEDVINMELTTEFLEAEVAFCRLVQDFYASVTEGLEFN